MIPLPSCMQCVSGRGGLPYLRIETPAASAGIHLHGAHVTHFQPAGQRPLLFLSGASSFEAGKPIRGGVPICFPWFGPRQDGGPGPMHGFARIAAWTLAEAHDNGAAGVELVFVLPVREAGEAFWPHAPEVRYRVTIGRDLRMSLEVRNTTTGSVRYEAALHTYLAVSDVRNIAIAGLSGANCLDRIGPLPAYTEGPDPIRIVAETDRIYTGTRATCIVDDPGWARKLVVEKSGSEDTVVWNPWIAKAKAMPDFGDDEWPGMLCIETCNVRDHAVSLAPGASHAMTATIRIGT